MARTIQFNMRADPQVADALRARAEARSCSLGAALAQLLEADRVWSGEDIALRVDPGLRRALDALAAADGCTPRQILDAAVRGDLRDRLLRLADAIAPADPPPARPEALAALADDPTEEPEVGLFTVFD